MDRRKAMKVAAGAIVGGGAGLFTLANAFKPKIEFDNEPHKLDYTQEDDSWSYTQLDPVETADLAYTYYSEGSCMYATVKSVIAQLTEKIGEPFASFPIHLFKYGHGGIGGYGSTCGTLNGAAALIGLLVSEKSVQDNMIADIFRWYEKEPLPAFLPQNASYDYLPAKSISNSVLCHASNTNWCKTAGFKVDSNERKERCRRLTADVAGKVATSFNELFTNTYTTNIRPDETAGACLTCHGSDGKVNNTAVKMSCTACHDESIAHKAFADIHYKLMK
ncbi:MAG: C-GCAxxG-C-C family protein [Prolixibacteraceae bacterium]|nr:C-GCAxxG-C-C family protein [Prolixibacteraceae bacterium]